MKKSMFIVLTIGLLGGLGWLGWWRFHEAKVEPAAFDRGQTVAVPVEIGAVGRGPIRDLRTFTGTVEPRARYVVAPKVGGRLESLAVNLGDPVLPKQLVAQLDDEEYRQQVAQAQATLEVARANVEQQQTAVELAQREYERVNRLWQRQATSEVLRDAADTEYKIQSARLKVALAQLAEKAAALKGDEVRLSYACIQLPEDASGGKWFVAERHVDVGAMLAANAPLVTIVDLDRVIAVIYAIERDYPALQVGLAVELETDAYPGRRFAGRIVRIAPVLQEGARQARIEIEVANADLALRPGMFTRIFIEFARRESANLVPRAAVMRHGNGSGVFLVEPASGTVRLVPVTPEITQGEVVAIAEQELVGSVVTLGQHLLVDGAKISLPRSATPVAQPAPAPSQPPPRP